MSQRDVIGDLVVTTELCDTSDSSSGALDPCDRGAYSTSPAGVQHFLAYLASDWLIAPATVGFRGDPGDVQLRRSARIEAAMQAVHAAPAGLRWVGYEGGILPQQQAGVPNRATATAVFAVPAGEPREQAIVESANSYRWASATDPQHDIDRPISCWVPTGSPPDLGTSDETECLYSHSWAEQTDPDTGITTPAYAATKQLTVAAPAQAPQPQQAPQGQPVPQVARDLIQTSQWLATALGSDRELRGRLGNGRGFTVTPNLPGGGFLRISLVQRPKRATDVKRPPVLFVGTGPTSTPGPKAIGVKPTKKGGPLLRKAKSFNGYLVLRFWDRSGKTVSTPLRLKLK